MKEFKVKITEKKKLVSSFNLYNFREEIVNFMYKKTVANSSRNSMVFYILIFFISLRFGSKSLLKDLLDNNIEKIKALNKKLSEKKRLKKGEYGKFVQNIGLKEIFKYDIFFLLVSSIVNSEKILYEFKDYFNENPDVKKEFNNIVVLYKSELESFYTRFIKNLIIDERIDNRGISHDLSKSVNRTIKMRTSRRLDLTLHKYAEVKNITSNSPVIVHLVQHINPEIIIQIWQNYKLDQYLKEVWGVVSTNNHFNGITDGIIGSAIYEKLAEKWAKWHSLDGKKNKKEKTIAKIEFDIAKNKADQGKQQASLINSLAKSVMNSNKFLQEEIVILKSELKSKEKENSILINNKNEIKELKDRIEKLENIDIEIEESKD